MRLAQAESLTRGLPLFDEAEADLIARAMFSLAQVPKGQADATTLSRLMTQLADINQLIGQMPSLVDPSVLGRAHRDEATLVTHLIQLDGLAGDLDLPLKATLQRTYLISKIQFLRAFVKATCALVSERPDFRALSNELREELAQSIYTLMAEELLLALLRKPDVENATKGRAAEQLITIWDNATLEIDKFCPLLESAWRARNRITAGLGSLLGTTEYFRLVGQNCADEFLDYFARDEVSDEENQAFSEFLFGLTYEELVKLREIMSAQGKDNCSEEWASRVLGRSIEHECDGQGTVEINPMSLYRSYSRRQLAADFRNLAGSEGPRRTAEAYLMIYILDHPQVTAPTPPVA